MDQLTGSVEKVLGDNVKKNGGREFHVGGYSVEYDLLEETLISLSLYNHGQRPNAITQLFRLVITGRVALCPIESQDECESAIRNMAYLRTQLSRMHKPLPFFKNAIDGYKRALLNMRSPAHDAIPKNRYGQLPKAHRLRPPKPKPPKKRMGRPKKVR